VKNNKPVIYKIIRFLPDIIKGEFINIGVIALTPSEKKIEIAGLDKNNQRAFDFFGKGIAHKLSHEIDHLHLLYAEIQDEIKQNNLETKSLSTYDSATGKSNGLIHYSNLRTAIEGNVTAEIIWGRINNN